MRLLILSCNTGEGHNSAAKALTDVFSLKNIECDTKDALAFWSPEKSKLISKGHVFVYRKMPKLFGAGYRFEENHPPKKGEESLIYEFVIKGCDALYEFLCENKYDAVICTHVFSAMMITELKKQHKCDLKSYFIATDYTCTPGVSETMLDKYFIPHPLLFEEFEFNGISKKVLVPSGIPVRQSMYIKTDRQKARKLLGLPQNKKIVLLTCGSMGCGPMKEICEYLTSQLGSDSMLVVVCGNNHRLYKSLTKYPLSDNIKVVGYTTRMSLYMDAATIILTKAGGLSSTEAAVKALPMIFINAVPGCETRNIEFFVSNGFADVRHTIAELCDLVCDYLDDSERTEKMRAALRNDFSGCASEDICEYIIKDVNSSHDRLQKIKT